jgi:predicted acyltransferase
MTVSDAPPASTTASTPVFREVALPYADPLTPRPTRSMQRLLSLDVFRGVTIAAMILVNNMGEPKYDALEHAPWHGWTPTDLIFPFFLFIVGVAMPFSMARRSLTTEQTKGQLLGRVWLRALSLWMLGQLLFAFPMPLNHALPEGFWAYKMLRWFSFVFVYGSILALLIPWRSKLLQALIPPIVAVTFYLLLIALHYTQKHATDAGWTGGFGGGVFNPDNLRFPGVLQRIGLVYGIGGTIALFAGWRLIVAAIVILCSIYSALMLKLPYGGHAGGSLAQEDNLARYVDEKVFDRFTTDANGKKVYTQHHTYRVYPDNEGLMSTIPAIGTCLLGVLVGLRLRREDRAPVERIAGVMAMGVGVLVLGWLLNDWLMPINKNLWTPSFVFFTGGLGMLMLGSLFWVIDVLGYRRWTLPAVVLGMNAIAAYVAASILPRLMNLIRITHEGGNSTGLYDCLHHYYNNGIELVCKWLTNLGPYMPNIASEKNLNFASPIFLILLIWVVMAVFYVFKIFVKV